MNLESNGAKAIAALIVLNAGLFLSHHRVLASTHSPSLQARIAATQTEICKVRTEARKAAFEARLQARTAQREATKARRQAQQDATRAAMMAPSSAISSQARTSITDYVHCLLTSSKRSVNGGV